MKTTTNTAGSNLLAKLITKPGPQAAQKAAQAHGGTKLTPATLPPNNHAQIAVTGQSNAEMMRSTAQRQADLLRDIKAINSVPGSSPQEFFNGRRR